MIYFRTRRWVLVIAARLQGNSPGRRLDHGTYGTTAVMTNLHFQVSAPSPSQWYWVVPRAPVQSTGRPTVWYPAHNAEPTVYSLVCRPMPDGLTTSPATREKTGQTSKRMRVCVSGWWW